MHFSHYRLLSLIACISCLAGVAISQDDGDLRLVGGTKNTEGRLEIYHEGTWGTICSLGFDLEEAVVACRQLGLPYADTEVVMDTFGSGPGRVWLASLMCTGYEQRLTDCIFNDFWGSICSQNLDVGLRCNGEQVAVGQLRLVNGQNEQSGRLEVFLGVYWGSVCSTDFDNRDATVACRQLGFDTSRVGFHANGYYGRSPVGSPVGVSHVDCSGDESRLQDCIHDNNPYCLYDSDDVGIECGEIEIGLTSTPMCTPPSVEAASNIAVIVCSVASVVAVIVFIVIVCALYNICRQANRPTHPNMVVMQAPQVQETPSQVPIFHYPLHPLGASASPVPHAANSNGYPVGAAKTPGSTSYPSQQYPYSPNAPQSTGRDVGDITPNAPPIILDASGEDDAMAVPPPSYSEASSYASHV